MWHFSSSFVSKAASMILILGYYGSMTLQLGPNCSRLIQPNSLFVQSIKVNIAANVISPFLASAIVINVY